MILIILKHDYYEIILLILAIKINNKVPWFGVIPEYDPPQYEFLIQG